MDTVDLIDAASVDSSFCHLCTCEGKTSLAQLIDKDLGPLCVDCFAAALRAETELRWALIMSPSSE